MIQNIGVDIVDISRVENLLKRWPDKFVSRFFTEEEVNYCRSSPRSTHHLAARLAAKEAVYKAMGVRGPTGIAWKDVEVVATKKSPPFVRLHNRAERLARRLGIYRIFLSLSHSKSSAVAVAVALAK